ncbi:MAG: 4-hydroxy-tetrahydrodipicolinate synthase [Firmicutes bacterium]|nr:4-hydroxy-tetrahydrodipicolinate synthase [Bacillota bacterium]
MQNTFGSLLTAMITPFDRQQRVNYEQVAELAKHLADRGSDGLVITGTTGESPALSNEEKFRIYDTVVRAVKGKTKIIAGTGCNSTLATIETSKKAEEIGVDGLMLVVPYYNKPPQEGLYLHFKSVANAVSLPIMLYNVPGRTAVNLSAATTLKLAEIDNIVAVKEASGNLEQITYICREAPEGFDVYSGDDSLTLPVLSVGGKGVVSVASHLVGLEMKAMIDAFFEGKIEEAVKKHQFLMPLFKALFVMANPIPVKAALNMAGIDAGRTRLPLSDMPEEMAADLLDLLKNYGIV